VKNEPVGQFVRNLPVLIVWELLRLDTRWRAIERFFPAIGRPCGVCRELGTNENSCRHVCTNAATALSYLLREAPRGPAQAWLGTAVQTVSHTESPPCTGPKLPRNVRQERSGEPFHT